MKPTSLLISIYTAPCPAVLQHSAHPFDAQTYSGEAQTWSKTGQGAPVHFHSIQNEVARSPAAAANSSCCIIRPTPLPSMPSWPMILLKHEDTLWGGHSGTHTVSNKRVTKQTRCIYIYMYILHILDECIQVFPGDACRQNQTHRGCYHPSINWVCKDDKIRPGKLKRILPWIKFQMHFLRIHRKETHKSINPMKANGWKIVQQRGKTWSSNFEKQWTGKLSAANEGDVRMVMTQKQTF